MKCSMRKHERGVLLHCGEEIVPPHPLSEAQRQYHEAAEEFWGCIQELEAVLAEMEWRGPQDVHGNPSCPVCGRAKRIGHASECDLAAVTRTACAEASRANQPTTPPENLT